MLFKGSMSSVGRPEQNTSTSPSLLERDLPPTPAPTSPVPSFSGFQENYVPPWMRDNASTASTTRQSRASSIVSTLTRFTTTSVDDARSIDIQVGGQSFRIARDASRITSEAPPPYTAAEARLASPLPHEPRSRTARHYTPPNDTNLDGPTRLPLRPRIATTLGANILDPTEVDIPSPVGDDDATPPSTPRTSSRASPRIYPVHIATRTQPPVRASAPIDTPQTVTRSGTIKPYQRSRSRPPRADLPLLSTTSDTVEMQRMGSRSSQLKGWKTVLADDLMQSEYQLQGPQPLEADEPQSPDYIGRDADGVFPQRTFTQIWTERARHRSDSGYSGEEDIAKDAETSRTPSIDSENEISLHYARMIRFIDKQHRGVLHARDKDMEKLRNRLAELDTVYRQQLRAKDFIIEDLRRRIEHLEDSMHAKLERARNEVEDVWERRWKDRDFHLRERMSRIESQTSLDTQISRENLLTRDEEEHR